MSDNQPVDVEKLLRELEFRMAVTAAILSTLDLDEILYVILCGITSGDGLGFNRAILLLVDDGRALRVRMAVGPPSAEAAGQIWQEIERQQVGFSELLPRFETFQQDASCQTLTRSLSAFSLPIVRLEQVAASPHALILHSKASLAAVLARCLVNRAPFCSNALTVVHELGGAGGELLELSHIAIVPLCVGDDLTGAIVADNSFSGRIVDSAKLRSLHAMGNLAALAIDRARLHAQTQAMAEIDGLTGVFQRRFYEQELGRALEAARAAHQPLSVAVFDLDHFKECNDTHGHVIGDELLKETARLLTAQVRQSDMVARYGGDEFVVLLRNTSEDAAVQVAEKLRLAICELRPAGRTATASAGIATACEGDDPTRLFTRADAALYAAKQAGRNRVMRWREGHR